MLSSNQSSWHPGDGIDDSAEASAAASGLPENVGSRLFTPLYESVNDSERHSARSVDVESGKISAQELGAKSLERLEDAIDSDLTALPHTMVAMAINDQVDVKHHDTNSSPASQHSANDAHSARMDASRNQLHEVASLLSRAVTLLSTMGDSHHPRACACHESTPSSYLLATNRPTTFTTPNNTGSALCNEAPANVADVLPAAKLEEPDPSGGKETHKPDPAQQPASTAQPVSLGQPTGWAAVEKALTDFDRQEIGGYKEDIDSLLTFTGLYSAVLTAFVIVSYPQLQEDTAGATLQVLRLIANQTATYTVIGQLVNSTAVAVTTTPPFQPSSAAIRINILWFTSLVISLATASFAILVKQWLRAYMAFASASPQGQLRIRHFRRAGLEAWKVFGIASMLPLFIQISLALFFVGLCVFTLDVHPTIGSVTLPLVAAWAFLFTAVTLSPVFTARCPYTTPALEGVTHLLRARVYPFLLSTIWKYIPYIVSRALQAVFKYLHNISKVRAFRRLKCSFWKSAGHFSRYVPPRLAEEKDVMQNAQRDLEILASADMLQADDRLLGTTIKSALEHSDANWVQIIDFIMLIISNRIPVDDRETNPQRILKSFHSLPHIVREPVGHIFKFQVIPKATREANTVMFFPDDWETKARWALCIFLDLNYPGAPLRSLYADTTIYDEWIRDNIGARIQRSTTGLPDLPKNEFLLSMVCARILTHSWCGQEGSFRALRYSTRAILHCCVQTLSRPQGLRSQIMEEAGRTLMVQLDALSSYLLGSSSLEVLDPTLPSTITDFTEAAMSLRRAAGVPFKDVEVESPQANSYLQATFRLLFRMRKLQSSYHRVKVLRLCCALEFTAMRQILQSSHHDCTSSDDDEILSETIHDIADIYLKNKDASPSRDEILKVSLLAVQQICGNNQAIGTMSERIWTPAAITRWARTLDVLSFTYFGTFISMGEQSSNLLEASRQLALYIWEKITLVDSNSHAEEPPQKLPITQYFYLMLWVAVGGITSQIPIENPQLLRIAAMSREDRKLIYDRGEMLVYELYGRQSNSDTNPPMYDTIEGTSAT